MRRLFLRLEVLVIVIVAGCLAVLAASSKAPAQPDLELTAGPGDVLTLSNSKEGSAVLTLAGMRPGDSVSDTVTLGNSGTIPGDFSFETSNLVDAPGAGGGALSGELDLRVRDVTNGGSPVTVYDGKIAALGPTDLGALAAGDSRVYEFRVSFPDAGPGAEDAYQGSSMSIQFDWTAFNPDNGGDTTPPETTITSAPPSLSASANTIFAFSADEPGSTFECSLDGNAFAACSTPTTYTGLAGGAHTFDVRATDAADNTDGTPARRSWTIDVQAPSKPKSFAGANKNGRLVFTWKAASDNIAVGAYLVYANGNLVNTVGASSRSASLGTFRRSDSRSFQVAARDTAGNVGTKTSALVIVPRVKNLTVADAHARLKARGLEAGTTSYAYSSSIASGRVIRAERSGVVPKSAYVGLRVSRGAEPRTPSTTASPAAPTYTPPASPPAPSSSGDTTSYPSPGTPAATGTPPEVSPDAPGNPADVEPESFVPGEEESGPSGLRRLLGLGLLGGAFLAAGAVALRARGPRVKAPEQAIVEPLMFWDQRLARTLSAAVRRLIARA
jgi:hypothetical protein